MSAELLNLLLSFQPDSPDLKSRLEYHNQARQFTSQVANISAQHFLKGADTSQDVLEVLNPAVNTIAYSFALQARIAAASDNPKSSKGIPDSHKPGGPLWNKMVCFLETADPVQLRYVGQEWRKLIEYIEAVARHVGTPALAIAPMRSGMIRLDPSTGTFTLTHLQFIQLCLETRSYAAALPILENYIHSLPSTISLAIRDNIEYSVAAADHTNSGEYIHTRSGHTEKIVLLDVQEYYLLGAMAYIGLRQFKKAKGFLEHVLVVPSHNVANGLMLEAYKKWVLVDCLVNGTMNAVPRTANGPAIKQVKAASRAYEALAEAFVQLNNTAKLRAQINAGKDVWAEDGNTGLANQLLDNQYRFYVSRLSRTFSAIPVSNISNNLGGSVDELTDYLKTLIQEGQLNAQLERTDKPGLGVVLRFFLDPTQGPRARSEKEQQQTLFRQTERTNLLAEQVKGADYRLGLSKEYIDYVRRQNKKSAASAGEAMDTSWDDGGMEEEDLMGDMQ